MLTTAFVFTCNRGALISLGLSNNLKVTGFCYLAGVLHGHPRQPGILQTPSSISGNFIIAYAGLYGCACSCTAFLGQMISRKSTQLKFKLLYTPLARVGPSLAQ